MKFVFCGSVAMVLLISILAQVLAGVSFPVVKFRASEPQAYRKVVGAYWVGFLVVVLVFLMWP